MSMPPGGPERDAFEKVDFDPHAVLERDSRILLDPRFLGTLHAEIERELGRDQGRITLFQMGFLHGLQDACRALEGGPEPRRGARGHAMAPPLVMDLRTASDPDALHRIELRGSWPAAQEAGAHRGALGAAGDASCYLSAGYTSGWLSGTLNARVLALETHCSAAGGAGCCFVAREAEAWLADADPRALALLEAVPFDAFRSAVREREAQERVLRALASLGEAQPASGFDREAAAIHVWGPVMVVPYAGPDETLRALDLIASDPQARGVSVIVLDLGGAIVDEAFGALALEQIVHTAEGWGTEVLFAEPSALSERVIAELDSPPLMVLKDLEHAIAAAFQIAQSQRRIA